MLRHANSPGFPGDLLGEGVKDGANVGLADGATEARGLGCKELGSVAGGVSRASDGWTGDGLATVSEAMDDGLGATEDDADGWG